MQGTSTSSWIHKIIGGTPLSVGPTCLGVVICYHLLDTYPPFVMATLCSILVSCWGDAYGDEGH